MNFSTRTNGKLLLTGEYFVTEGAVALALPTQLGQSLDFMPLSGVRRPHKILRWESYDNNNELWFSTEFVLDDLSILEMPSDKAGIAIAEVLQDILKAARHLNPKFLKFKKHLVAKTVLEFPRNWGLGTSSTLVSMIAQWAEVDAYELLSMTMGGSGYDIAAATANGPLLFQKFNGVNRMEAIDFNPPFADNLYFVHLGKKQDSRLAMVYYTTTPAEERHKHIGRITQITHNITKIKNANQEVNNLVIAQGNVSWKYESLENTNELTNAELPFQKTAALKEFEALVKEHEEIVASVIKQTRAKDLYFGDFWGEVKSLGAWGGDFVLVTSEKSEQETRQYFSNKGFDTVLTYAEMIKTAGQERLLADDEAYLDAIEEEAFDNDLDFSSFDDL